MDEKLAAAEALSWAYYSAPEEILARAAALRAEAQEDVREPVAWRIPLDFGYGYLTSDLSATYGKCEPLYLAPPDKSERVRELERLLREAEFYVKFSKEMGDPSDLSVRIAAALAKGG